MEHRQIWKNSMKEGSTRIPLFFSGAGISKNIISNPTQIIDVLPTLIDIGGGEIPGFLDGYSLTQYFGKDNKYFDGNNYIEHPAYITSQYHARNGQTGTFMVRKDKYKYIQFGHNLNAYKNYSSQLYDLENDPLELNNIGCDGNNDIQNICNEMEGILKDLYDYEYTDCIAKKMDYTIFEEYFWNKYNESEMYDKLSNCYHGFDQNDWQNVLNWRSEVDALSC